MDTTRLQLFDTNEEPKPIKPAVDVARYLDDDEDNYVSKPPYSGYIPNSTVSPSEDLYRSKERKASPQPSEDFYQHLGKPNANKALDTTDGIPTDQHLISPINIDQYVGQMVENKVEGKRLDDTMDDLETYETYEANKEIQRLLEKVSDDEEEPVKPLLPRQTIEVILIDETKKKKKKKPKKTKIETASDETMFHEPMPNDFELLQPTAAEIVKPVQGKKERVDTKEIAVQTMPVPDDMDSEDDSDQEILQYQQRSAIGGYLINTIPEEQEDESPLSTPDQNSGSSIYEQQIYRERGFLFRNTNDHEPTPRRPNQINQKEAYLDPSFLPQKYFFEPTITHDEEQLSEFSPYKPNHSPQIHETPQNQTYQPGPWQEGKQPDQPDDEEKGFDFDMSRQDIQSSSTINTKGLLKPIYKPRFEIQDFIEEDHRRQTRLLIQAPPSKKHKMSSPYSPIDDTLLERDPHQKDEPVPVLDELKPVTPSYAPKYEIHDFVMQDVEGKLKPMPSTITNGFVLKENEHEIETYLESEPDLRSDIKVLNRADTEKRSENVASKQDGLTFTESEYLPRLDTENSKDQCLEPLNNEELPTKHDTPEHILPRYEPRFEIQDLIAKESQRDEQPKYENLAKRTESPVFISPKEPELLSNQPGFEVTSFILNEEHGREEKYNDQESDTDDSLSNLYNQPEYKPRYTMDDAPNNKTYKVDVTLEENKDMPFQLIGKEIIRQTTEAERKEEKNPSLYIKDRLQSIEPTYRSQQQPVPDYRAVVPLTEQEPIISPYEIGEVVLEPRSQRIGSKPIQTKSRITTSAAFVVEEPKPLEEKREPEHTSSAYQPRCEIINFVLQEQPEQPEEFEVNVKKEETKPNRSFHRPKFTVDEIILQEGFESEDESISSESIQKQPVTDETVQISLKTKFEDEPDFYRPYQPQHKVKVFVLDEDPLLTRALPEKQDESTADNSPVASNELNFTKSAKITTYEIQDLEREHKVREFVMEEPENENIPKHPTTDQTVQTSTETTVEDEPDFYRPFEPQHEVKSFVLDEGPLITRGLPKKQDESTTDKSPVSVNELNFTRSVNIPKYETPDLEKEYKAREIVIEEEPENERIPKHSTTDETVQTSTETTVEDEPDFYRPFEPQHEVKSFLLEEGPLITRGLPKKQDESTTDKSPVSINELNFTRSANIPRYEIPDLEKEHKAREIVIEEEPENERIPKHPTTDETVQTSTETTVEDEPDFYRLFEQQHEVKSFVLDEGPLITGGLPKKQDKSTTDKSPVSINEQNFTRSVNIPKYEIPDIEKEHKAREIVIEEEPENERIPKHPTTDENVQTSTETTVEDEPDFYRPFELQHEVKSFVLDEGPLITGGLPKKQDESTTDKSPVSINEQNFTRSVNIPKYEIPDIEKEHKAREIVIEEEPENERIPKHPTDETVQTSTETTVEDEPDFYRPFEPQHEVKSFVLEESPLITRGLPKKQDESTTDESPVFINELNFTRSVNIPKYEIPDLEKEHKAREIVIEEEPETERIPKHPTTDETVQTSTETTVEDEPDFYKPFEPQHEVRSFVLDEGPLITGGLPKKQDESTTDKSRVSINEQNFTRSVTIPKYEIPDIEKEHKVREIVIEEDPENERISKQPAIDETVQITAETSVEDEPDFYGPFEPKHEIKSYVLDEGPLITRDQLKKQDESTADKSLVAKGELNFTRSVNIPKYKSPDLEREHKIREFVIEEEPENERISQQPTINETVQITTETSVEDEPDFYRPFEPQHQVKSFALDEDPLITRDLLEKQDESTAHETSVVTNELNFTRSVNIAKYEIPGLEREHKVREFVIEEEPKDERIPKYPSTDETVQTSTETTVEDKPDYYRPFEPQQKVSFVSDEGPLITNGLPKKQDESTADQTPISLNEPDYIRSVIIPKYEIPDVERVHKAREFVIEEEPENERISKQPTIDETVQITAETSVEDEPDFYRPFERKHEVKSYVLDEGPLITCGLPKKQDESTADKSPVAKGELNFTRSVNIPKYKIPDLEREHKVRELVIDEEPENERISQQPTINETEQITAETSVEDEPDVYRPFEPHHQVKNFALDEDPLITRDLLEKQNESTADKTPVVTNELNFTRSVNIAKYEIPGLEREHKVREFVIEEEQEDESIPKYTSTDETVQTSTETTVEDEPDFYKPFEPQQEVSFVSDEGPLITNGLPKKHDESTADQTPISLSEPDYITSVNIPKYEIPDVERVNKARDVVIEEEPENEHISQQPTINETAQITAETSIEDEPDVYRPFEPQHQVKSFALDEDPLITPALMEKQDESTADETPVVTNELNFTRSVNIAKYEIPGLEREHKVREIVIEEEPEDERIPKYTSSDETVQTSTETTLENEPDFYRPFEPQQEISFVSDKGPLITNGLPKKQDESTADKTPVITNELNFTRSVNIAKYEIPGLERELKVREFVIEEEPADESIPKYTSTDETVQTSTEVTVEDEPDFYKPFEPQQEVSFVPDEGPLITNGLPNSQQPTINETVQITAETSVEDEPDVYRPFEPQHQAKNFALDEDTLITRDLLEKQDESTADKTPVITNELNFTRSVNIAKYEIPGLEIEHKVREFVIEEEPADESIPKYTSTDETVQTSTEATVEDEPDFYKPFEPQQEVSFVPDEGPLITNGLPKKHDESTADQTPISLSEPDYITSVNIPKYEIPDVERVHKARDFVIEEEPENEHISQQPTINETVQITAETSVEEEPDIYRPFEPQHQVKNFALDEDPLITRDLLEKQDESTADKTPVVTNELNFTRSVNIAKYEIPGLEREHKVREFIIEEEPKDESIPKYTSTDETVQTSTEATVEDEPDFYRPFESQQEVSFVSDEGLLITNGLPKKHDESTADQTPISMNEPDYVRSVNIPKYEMPGTEREHKAREFVINEKPENERTQKRPVTDEKTQTSIQAMNEEEPDVYRPFQEKDKVKGFVSDEDPLIQQVEPKKQVKTTTGERFVPDYIRSAGNLEQKFTDSELDSRNYQPHMGDETTDQVDAHTTSVSENKPKRPEGKDNIVFTTERHDDFTNVTPYVKEKQEQEIKTISSVKQEHIRFRYQQRYKLEEFVLIEEPEQDEGPPSTPNEKHYESFRIITDDQGPHTTTPQNQSGNAPLEKGFNQEEVSKETNIHPKFVIEKEEPREITVNTVETSQINYESYQEVETILVDEPSRLDIDYVNDDPSEKAGPEFKSDLQTMLSHRYGTKEKAIAIVEGESIDKTTSRQLKTENKIEAGLLEDIETQANAFSTENVSKTRNVDDSGNKTDTKFNSSTAADDIRSVENLEEIVENVTSEINPAKTLVLEDEMEHFEPEPQKTMGSVDEKTGIPDKKSAGIENITTERTNELETEDSSQSETDDIIANLAGGKERMDRDENIDIQIAPSYIREVHPTEVTPTEQPFVEQEIQEESSENVKIETLKNIRQIEKREKRSIDIANVNECLQGQTAEEIVISNQHEKTQGQTIQLLKEHSELLKTTEEAYVYPKDESQPSIAKSLTLISVDVVDSGQEEIPIVSESLPIENDGLSQLVRQSSRCHAGTKSPTVAEEMKQDVLPKGGEDIAVEMSNKSEIMDRGVEAKRVDDINIITEQTSSEKESVIIYPLNRPEGMIIQLVDDIEEPSQPAFRGTAIIEKPEQRRYLKKRTEHTAIHEISRPAHHELENSRTEFTENIPDSVEQRFVGDVDLQSEVETGPHYTNEGEMIAQDGKKLASVDVRYLETNDAQEVESVNSEEDKIINIGRESPDSTYGWEFAELSTKGPVVVEIENERQSMMTTFDSVQNNEDIDVITGRYQREAVHGLISESQPTRGIAVDHEADLPTTKTERATMNDEIPSRSIKESKFETRTNMRLVTVYPLNEPQGITIQLIDDIEPVEPEYKGTAIIQKTIDEKPARTIHTPKYYHSEITDTKTTEFLEDIPPANIGQTFVGEHIYDIPMTFVDGKSGVGGDAYDKSEHAVIKGTPISADPVNNTHTCEQFNETDAINHEESEVISIASGTSSLGLQDDITIEPVIKGTPISADPVNNTHTCEQFNETDAINHEESEVISIASGTSSLGLQDDITIEPVIKGTPISADPVNNTHTREQFNETDAINHEESEVISIASGTSSLGLQDDITIEPSYVRQVDPSGLVITETIGGKEEIVQLNELPSTTGESDTAQRKLERSIEIKTVTESYEPGQSIRMLKPTNSEYDQEHIYARVDKQRLGIPDENTKPMALVGKSSGDSVIVDHQPGATTIAMVEKRSVPVFEKGQIDDKDFEREVYNRNSEQGEISQSTDTMPHVSYTGTKYQGSLNQGSLNEGVVWMTVRHSKKLFGVGGNERIITLPIVNKLPSSNFSPTEDSDFDLDNDGEMFSQRHKPDASGEYYTSTRVLGLEEISVHRESMMKESEQDKQQQSGTRTSVMEQFKEPGDGEIQEQDVEKLQQERYHDYPRAGEYENECIESANIKTSEDVSRQSMRETITVDNWTAENDVWCTVKLKRWESDIRGIHSSNQFKGKGASELSSSTASIDGTYAEDTDRPRSPNSEISMKTESSVPWISIKRKSNKGANAKDHQAGESVGYSMQLTATDAGVLMTEDTLSGVETLDTESTLSTNIGDVTTLPWIEVRKRDSIRQRFSIAKKKRDGTPKGVTHTTDGKDRLLLVKIPQTMLLEIENDDKMLETEVEIPWMELDQSAGKLTNLSYL